ncbi:MAG: hypothetical protein COT85_04090 [Chlamydiae bacterium CG10_big_fil_rev_8_21_14_0_10_42_34]|nr:MAG: hypothetical protein COT85_04090 [Chlamydiae bacterium CG10_big_fil_rev_8_21_14_0_10_42_34]
MGLIKIAFLCFFALNLCRAEAHQSHWHLGGDLKVCFESDVPFQWSEKERIQFSAHLPGFNVIDSEGDIPSVTISHTYSELDDPKLLQKKGRVEISSDWKEKFPPDFIHLLYGTARIQWLKKEIFPVHAACIGNEEEGYSLLIGAPGSGKTSLTLQSVMKHDYKVFSGDKTLLRINEDGEIQAIAGTRTLTVRAEDVSLWETLPKVNVSPFGDRLAFELAATSYSTKDSVPIRRIFLVTLNNGTETFSELSSLSALHTLYPFFIDKQREDILIEGGSTFFDGSIGKTLRAKLAKKLDFALEKIPTFRAVGSLEKISSLIAEKSAENIQAHKKILFGVCGIGSGHCHRQFPIIKHLLNQNHQVLVFTYGDGLHFFKEKFPNESKLTVIPVADPYYVGTPFGLDLKKTATSEKNQVNFNQINNLAMHKAAELFGVPDLVISDYEMVAAQYSYIKNVPLVTLDQQSKYLVGEFLPSLNGTSYLDEIERLHLFFPKAEKRFAISFFNVLNPKSSKTDAVEILPPILRPEILQAKCKLSERPSILVYITAQQIGEQPIDEWIKTLQTTLPSEFDAHIFLPRRFELPRCDRHTFFYHHGDVRFDSILFASHGIISTAGHTLLSEAMHLEKPVYALPLPLYEQQLNGHIIAQGKFGICTSNLNKADLSQFLNNLSVYSKNIRQDQQFLLKTTGNSEILEKIELILNRQ